MTMVKKRERSVPAGEFKAKCLRLLDEVAATGQALIVTKHGKPVARIVPAHDQPVEEIRKSLRRSVLFEGDVLSPIDEKWDADE
jgi:prevent-host-death family protein